RRRTAGGVGSTAPVTAVGGTWSPFRSAGSTADRNGDGVGRGCSGPGRALVVRCLRTRAGPGTPSACPARQRYFRALVAAEGWRDRTAHVEAVDRAGRNRHGPAPLPLAF